MSRLYIIGNGFDCYGHIDSLRQGMKTTYSDFRNYLIEKYGDLFSLNGVPYKRITWDRDYNYSENEQADFIIQILDNCEGKNWCNIEHSLGTAVFDEFSYEFEELDFNSMEDKEIGRAIASNSEIGESINAAFIQLKKLFSLWVTEQLAEINYSLYSPNAEVTDVFGDNIGSSKFLSFNYTQTLEVLYGVNSNKVFHIHGVVGNSTDSIVFGHGSEEECSFDDFWGCGTFLNDLKKALRKDTESIIRNNTEWFNKLDDINEIYSYGFSFSEVDMKYIVEISKNIDCNNTIWYLNSYDYDKNKYVIKILENLGFKVNCDRRW